MESNVEHRDLRLIFRVNNFIIMLRCFDGFLWNCFYTHSLGTVVGCASSVYS